MPSTQATKLAILADASVDAILTPDGFMLSFAYTVGAAPQLYVRMEGADYVYACIVESGRDMDPLEAERTLSRLYARMRHRRPWIEPSAQT